MGSTVNTTGYRGRPEDPAVDATTVQQNPLGLRVFPNANEGFVYVKNGEASTTLAIGDICIIKDSATDCTVIRHPGNAVIPAHRIVGIVEHTDGIAAASYGWVKFLGTTEVQSSGTGSLTFAWGDPLVPETGSATDAGHAANAAAGEEHCVIGYFQEVAADPVIRGTLLTCFIDCSGGI